MHLVQINPKKNVVMENVSSQGYWLEEKKEEICDQFEIRME